MGRSTRGRDEAAEVAAERLTSGFLPRESREITASFDIVETRSTPNRHRWPRVTLTLPPDAADALALLAHENFRPRRLEALRILLSGIEREARRAAKTP